MGWTTERWTRIEAVFHDASLLPPAERAAFVAKSCGGDDELRAAVERLLAADAQPDDPWLEQGIGTALRGESQAGARFGAFELVERIAEGGMGTVHRARRVGADFEQIVAVKVLRFGLSTPAMRARFARERQTLARLVHPNVARLLDGGTTPEGVPFIAMEFVDGVPLDRFCSEHTLPLRERLRLFVAACGAVQFAHQNLVVHLDLKPSNILVDRHGTAKLLDFGVAAMLDEMRDGDGARPLTPRYASPEQQRGEPVSTAADVYSLGVVLRELAAGDERTLHRDLDAIVAKAAHDDPAARYASCQALADDVERFVAGAPVHARAGGVGYRVGKFVRRNAIVVGAATIIATSLVGGIVATSHMASVANEQRVAAELAREDMRKAAKIAEQERDAAEDARQRAEQQMVHARIESTSAQHLATFLGDTLLSAEFASTPEARARLCNVIDQRAGQFRREHQRDPHLLANLLDALGRARARVGEPADAERLLVEARDLRKAAYGEQSLEYAQSLSSLGTLWYGNGRLDEAAAAFRTCYELHRACPTDVHTDVARAANDLAAAERALGNVARARELHEEALELRRRGGAETALVAESLNNLANSERDPAKAADLLAQAWRIRQRVLGPDDPLTIQSAINVGSQAVQQGEFDEARPILRDAIAAARALGDRGVELLTPGLRSLAYAELRGGDVDAAERAATEAVQLGRPGTPLLASALEVAATVQDRRGRLQDAVASWQQALTIRQATLPAGHRTIERTRQQLDAAVAKRDAAGRAPGR